MHALFSPDSKLMQAMSRIGDLVILNVLYLLTCVPIVTIGAANTALYTVCFRFGTVREQGVVRSYFRAFRDNFKQGTILWLLVLVCGAAAGCNTLLFYSMNGVMRYAYLLFAILFVLVLLIAALAFPLLSQFDNDNKTTLKNALLLSVGYLPRSLLVAVLNVFPFGLMIFDFYMFLQASFAWVTLYFATAAYTNTFLLKKVFAPYMTELEEETE